MPIYLQLIFIFSGIGLLDTIYLSYHIITNKPEACPFFPPEWCHKVQYSPQSKTFGIPNGFAGFGMYTAILLGTWLAISGYIPFWPITVVVTIGFLFSMYFLYVQAFVLKAFCPWCLISALNFTVMGAAVYFLQ